MSNERAGKEMKIRMLRAGDPCPCCGQPIQTTDPLKLAVLTAIAYGALPDEDDEGGNEDVETG